MSIDPIVVELMTSTIASITDEMMITTHRTGYSNSVKYIMDFSAALFNTKGEMISQGVAQPHHLGAMPGCLRFCMQKFPDEMHPGDLYIINDPYEGGTHLPDIFMIKPIFWQEQRIGFAVVMSHHTDVGGRTPGSMAADSTSIHQEGLRLPPLKWYDRGKLNQAVTDIICANVRMPAKVMGDLRAEAAACAIGERGLLALVARYGLQTAERCWDEMMAYTERLMRQTLGEMRPGIYSFVDYLDDDGVGGDPLRVQVKVEVSGDSVHVDFTGTSPQAKGAINNSFECTVSSVHTVLRCLLPSQMPNNAGCFRPITVTAPSGTFLNANYPAACAAKGVTAYRVDDALFGALAQALPHRIPAACEGGQTSLRFAGRDLQDRQFIHMEIITGSRGGRPNKDGIEGIVNPQQNLSNTPVEVVEADVPLRVHRYGFVPDTGGPGKYRGGLSLVREWETLTDNVTLQVRSDRRRFLPWGVQGGKSGTPSNSLLNPGGNEEQLLPVKFIREVKQGTRFFHVTPGAGGYGNPLDRDPALVLADVRNDKLTLDYVRREYGVVIDPSRLEVDEAATLGERERLAAHR